MVDINLLEQRQKGIAKSRAKVDLLGKRSLMVLGVAIMLFLAVQAVRGFFWVSGNNIQERIDSSKAQLSVYSELEEDNVLVAQRLDEIARVIKGRDQTSDKLEVVFRVFDQGTVLRQISFGGVTSGKGLLISGSADDIFAYIDFDENIKDLAEAQGFDGLEMESLSRDGFGGYRFVYRVSLGEVGEV